MIRYFLMILMTCSCFRDDPSYQIEKGIPVIKGVDIGLNNLTELDWKVGTDRSKLVSMGLRFDLKLSSVNEKTADILFQKHKADSWIFKVIHYTRTGYKNELGSFYVEFIGNYQGRMRFQDVKFASFKVFYAAAAMSEDFRRFTCPAFNHRKKISQIKYDKNLEGNKDIYINSAPERFDAKTEKIFLVPPMYNGGNSLEGSYEVSYALYDSASRKVLSSWSRIDQLVQVVKENFVKIPECQGVKEENKPRDQREFKFKFGR